MTSSNSVTLRRDDDDDNDDDTPRDFSTGLDILLQDKIASATREIERSNNIASNTNSHFITTHLRRLALSESKENVLTICDYIEALVNESNPVPQYRRIQIQLLCYLSSFFL